MKTEATNFNIGRGLLGEKNFQRESEAMLSFFLFFSGVSIGL